MKLRYDLKRIFSNRVMTALCVLAPMVTILLFSAVFAPFIATSGELKFSIAICNEDESDAAKAFVDQYVNSQAMRGIITAYPVKDPALAEELLRNGDVSVAIYIPEGIYESIESGRPKSVLLLSTGMHALEVNIIDMTLSSSLSVVSQSQNVLSEAADALKNHGVSAGDTETFLSDSLSEAIDRFMSRRTILGETGVSTTLDNYLPIEYYTGAIFALFAALSMLPLIRITAADAGGPVLRRGLLAGRSYGRFFAVRVLAGTLLILLVLSTLLPAMLALRHAGAILGDFSGSLPALAASMLLTAVCFSAMAAAIGFWLPRGESAVWLGFYLVFFMAVCCGALLPSGTLPSAVAAVGKWLPLRPAMRMLSAALFRMDGIAYWADFRRLSAFAVLALLLGAAGARRRGLA
ncbi:MAG: ABC transporter permease [Clostridia bacterium]|nr:ABC transporter permease [Clostridia bacterium]